MQETIPVNFHLMIEESLSLKIRWYDLPGQWLQATNRQRLATVLPPIGLAPVAFADRFLFVGVIGMTTLYCLIAGLGRLSLQWSRRQRSTRITAWRLPLTFVVCFALARFLWLSIDVATEEARDFMFTLGGELETTSHPPSWPCDVADAESRCQIRLGLYPMIQPLLLDRQEWEEDAIYTGTLYLFIDHQIRFEMSRSSALEITERIDERTIRLDPETLQQI